MIKNIVLKFVCLIILLLVFGCDWLYNPKDYRLFPGNYGRVTVNEISMNSFELSWSKAFIGEGEYGFDSAESYPDGVTYSIYLTSDLVDKDSIQTSSRLFKEVKDIVNTTLVGLEPGTIYFYCLTADYKFTDKVVYHFGAVQTLKADGSDPDEDDDSIERATYSLANGLKINGETNSEGDVDYYKFSAKAGTIYKISTSTNNVGVCVLDDNKQPIKISNWEKGVCYIPYDGEFYVKVFTYLDPYPYWFSVEENESMRQNLIGEWTDVTTEPNKFKTFYADNASKDILLLEWQYKNPSDDSLITIYTSTRDTDSYLSYGRDEVSELFLPTKGYDFVFTEIKSYKDSEVSGRFRINKISDDSIKNIPLSEWVSDDFNGKEYKIYSAEVKQNTKYNIYWDNTTEETAKYINITCYGKNELEKYFDMEYMEHLKPKEVFTGDETNIILVLKHSYFNNGDTFAIKIEEVIE